MRVAVSKSQVTRIIYYNSQNINAAICMQIIADIIIAMQQFRCNIAFRNFKVVGTNPTTLKNISKYFVVIIKFLLTF